MSFSQLLNQTCVFTPRTSTKNAYNRETFTLGTTGTISKPCYLTTITAAQKLYGKEQVQYTHRLFTDYFDDVVISDFIAVINTKQYEIKDVITAYNDHHLEFLLQIVENR